ncbi:hypothetical protein CONLIGDRAFT_694502 [Coniochaeta ligniaria NRRL 30616]|uniref:Uncharacterized protein n=1 Tax=Coniochaeta ligniaria NRRL 30616 TaxID=1408157 RepID=A0A1J7J1K9_9PEZI|nr:hypothetical protein CONLIGDRAFT_694502 [Coniochaeta ligniaria NRRL 30616]
MRWVIPLKLNFSTLGRSAHFVLVTRLTPEEHLSCAAMVDTTNTSAWQRYQSQPVLFRIFQLSTRGIASAYDVASVVMFARFCAKWPSNQTHMLTTGFAVVIIAMVLDCYEVVRLSSPTVTRVYPVNPCASCLDILVVVTGLLGYILLGLSEWQSGEWYGDQPETPPPPPPGWSHDRDVLGIMLLANL